MQTHGGVPRLPSSKLGSWGPVVSRLGIGGEGILRSFGRDQEARLTVDAALACGIDYFESARAYRGSEAYYGSILGARRESIFLASKAHDRSRAGALASLETSLHALRTGWLDLWQLHDVRQQSELDEVGAPEGAYAAFADAKTRGLVRAIGVTGHYDPFVLRSAVESFAFDAVLLPINPVEGSFDDSFERIVIPAARERGMAVIGMKVFCGGLLLEQPASIRAGEAIRYALSADCDSVVIGCMTPADVGENARAACEFSPMSQSQRRALEGRAAPFAPALAYYRKRYAA